MKSIYKYLTLLVILYIVFSTFDYFKYDTFNWTENIMQTLFFMAFFGIFIWLFNSRETKNQ